MKTGIEIITEERKRQVTEEGWTYEHDKMHTNGELADAASCYAISNENGHKKMNVAFLWPFDIKYWKPTPENRIKELANAGALIAAQIDLENGIDYSKHLNKKEFEYVTCECGRDCQIEFAIMNEDGNWICPSCQIDSLTEKLKE